LKDSNLFRLRVGDYRVFFTLDQDGKVQIITLLNVTRRTTTTYH